MADQRIIVCGSRNWSDREHIHWVLHGLIDQTDWYAGANVVIVHGACPTGADSLADAWAKQRELSVESYPADWEGSGIKAGPLRNLEMAKAGASLCVAFIYGKAGDSRGSWNMVAQAFDHSIPVFIVPERRAGRVAQTGGRRGE